MNSNEEPREGVTARLRRNLGPAAKKVGQEFGKAWKATARSAEKTTRVVALRAKVSAKELKIRGLFYRIGEDFYRAQKAGKTAEENAASLRAMTDTVDKLKGEIAALKKEEKVIRAAR